NRSKSCPTTVSSLPGIAPLPPCRIATGTVEEGPDVPADPEASRLLYTPPRTQKRTRRRDAFRRVRLCGTAGEFPAGRRPAGYLQPHAAGRLRRECRRQRAKAR